MDINLNINNTFSELLPADPILENYTRQINNSCFSYVQPNKFSKSKFIHASKEMALELGFKESFLSTNSFLNIFSGNRILEETKPYAMNYGGHQFGTWAGQLGDGRAINLFEVLSKNNRWAIQLKGAGKTPYSRQGDGLAVLRSSIREYLCSEAMYHLGVPTTRALSLVETGEQVLRDVMYDGNSAFEKGAIITRVAPSFIRFGNFELFAVRDDYKTLKKLTDYTIKYFYPDLGIPSKQGYVEFFDAVAKRTLKLIIHWQRVGFVHGVMNTDNMSILGLTIDYGPYGWQDNYDLDWTPNTTDRQHKRYRFGNQPYIGLWNLYQLANALYPLVEDAKPFEKILNEYKENYEYEYVEMMRSKLGLLTKGNEDKSLINLLESLLQKIETDMTIFFRLLSNFNEGEMHTGLKVISSAFYNTDEVKEDIKKQWEQWFKIYSIRLKKESATIEERKTYMNTINPKYVLRNYMAQLVIDDANKDDYSLLYEIFDLLKTPYNENPKLEKWFAKRPEWAKHKVGCSMLSCSS